MIPFEKYPRGGSELLGMVRGSNCRHEYGLKFMVDTGETCCAYCGTDFTQNYEIWLSMVLDHVVPTSVCLKLGVPDIWAGDQSNFVLACGACNGFCNRYRLSSDSDISTPPSLQDFYKLRDKVFDERKKLIKLRHESERAFFDEKRWTKSQVC